MEVERVGKTSSKVKDRYNAKAYDEIKIRVPKGYKETLKAHAEKYYGGSMKSFINQAIDKKIEEDSQKM